MTIAKARFYALLLERARGLESIGSTFASITDMARIGYANYSLLLAFMRELMPINRSREVNLPVSEKTHPKHSFSKKLGEGEFLSVAVWAGRSNPEDEVLSVQLRKFDGSWRTLGRLALYRTKEGTYSELPERATAQA